MRFQTAMKEDDKQAATSPEHEISDPPSPLPSDDNPSKDYYLSLVFILVEVCFAALAWYCLRSPIQVNFSLFDSSKVKSGFITIFTLWHAIAIAFAHGVCANSFSREWAANPDDPTDVVSSVTTTLFERFIYFFGERATKTYRAAFFASIILMIMGTTAPSTITVSSNIESGRTIPLSIVPHIDSITLAADVPPPATESFYDRLIRVESIMELEKVDGLSIGYVPEPNWFIPLPYANQADAVQITYKTDLAKFRYSCEWRAPGAFNAANGTFTINNQTWQFLYPLDHGSDIIRSAGNSSSGSTIIHLVSETPAQNNGTSVYLFLGGSSQFPINDQDNPNLSYIDLTGMPFLHDERGFASPDLRSPPSFQNYFTAPLATVLVCNPNLEFTTGTVVLEPTANVTEADVRVKSTGDSASPGNIDPDSVKILFAESLLFAASRPDEDYHLVNPTVNFNSVAADMFLTAPASGIWENSSAIQPRPLDEINKKIDSYMLTGLKAFTFGFRPTNKVVDVPAVALKETVPAQLARSGLSLGTNLEYTVLHSVLMSIEALLLLTLAWLNVHQNRTPFTLRNVQMR